MWVETKEKNTHISECMLNPNELSGSSLERMANPQCPSILLTQELSAYNQSWSHRAFFPTGTATCFSFSWPLHTANVIPSKQLISPPNWLCVCFLSLFQEDKCLFSLPRPAASGLDCTPWDLPTFWLVYGSINFLSGQLLIHMLISNNINRHST